MTKKQSRSCIKYFDIDILNGISFKKITIENGNNPGTVVYWTNENSVYFRYSC
jgi:hypothetical protein